MKFNSSVIVIIVGIAISLFSGIQISHSALTDNYTLTVQGQITSTPTSTPTPTPMPIGTIYWRTGFENGFNDINNGGETETLSSYATISVVTSPVYKGNNACKAEIVTPPPQSVSDMAYAKALRWVPMKTMPEAYYGAALYLSPTFSVPSNGWTNIMQLHELAGNGVFLYLGVDSGLHLTLSTQQPTGTYAELWKDTKTVSLATWFTAVFYLRSTTNGAAALYINNQQVYSGNGNYAPTDGNQGPFFDTGIYQSYNCPTNYVVSDEMICASTLTAATPTQS